MFGPLGESRGGGDSDFSLVYTGKVHSLDEDTSLQECVCLDL